MNSSQSKSSRITKIIKNLRSLYPDAETELDYSNPLELLVAVILSAQCTDTRVNKITKTLFKKYKTAADYASASQEELEKYVHSAGFFRMKASAIRESAKIIAEKFNGRVPRTMEELLELKGVARKTANVVLGNAYGIASGVVVDTHVKRLARRMGLSVETDPVKIEKDLMRLVPEKDWIWFSHAMVLHGRRVCAARNPDCLSCKINSFCLKKI